MSDHVRLTVQEVADRLGVERESARGLVRFLVELGLARCRGERPSPRGRGENVYSFEDGFEERLATRIRDGALS